MMNWNRYPQYFLQLYDRSLWPKLEIMVVEGQVFDPSGQVIATSSDVTHGALRVDPTLAGMYSLHLRNTDGGKDTQLLSAT